MILKNPTWQSLHPGLPKLVSVDPKHASLLQQSLNLRGDVQQVQFDNTKANAFVIRESQGGKSYFIKLLTQQNLKTQQNAEAIAHWLQTKNIPINASLNQEAIYFKNSYCYIYPYIVGERMTPTIEYLSLLGTRLAKLHSALSNYPHKKNLTNNTDARLANLIHIRNEIASNKLHIGPVAECVRSLAQQDHLDFTQGDCRQVLHGDLNPGNILITSKNDILFFDFEDTTHSVLPTIYELVYIIERMIFTRVNDEQRAYQLGCAFMRAYINAGGNYRYIESDSNALLALTLRSLCVLSLCEQNGLSIYPTEWLKFQTLSQLAQNTKPLLKKILTLQDYLR